jgi:hypothetical protein
VLIAAAGLALTIGVTGCTSSESKSAGSAAATSAAAVTQAGSGMSAAASAAAGSAAPAATSAAAAPASAAASAAAGTSAAAGSSSAANSGLIENRPPLQTDPTAGRSIIYTARIDLQVQTAHDVATTAEKIAQAADDNGYVFSRNDQDAADNAPTPATPNPTTSPTPTDTASADLVLKVTPGSAYDGLVTKILKLGKPQDFNEKTSDVTNQVVDTQARLTAQKASVARIRVLLDKATTIGQIVQVEGELTRREADLESLEGTLNVLKAQTALATISVHIEQAPPAPTPTATPTPTVPPKPKKHIHGFGGGLKAGSHSFVTGAVGFATVVGALLPYLALLLALLVIAFLVRRSVLRGRRTAAPPETTAAH